MLPFGDPLKLWGPMYYRASISLEKLVLPGDKVGTFKYVLATGIKMAPDKSYYDVSLRQGVKFHDGTDFNAAAVKWNLDRVKAAKGVELKAVSSIEVKDDYTVRLNLSAWNNTILSDLTHINCFMISPAESPRFSGLRHIGLRRLTLRMMTLPAPMLRVLPLQVPRLPALMQLAHSK